jgi:hypothetical protein
MIGSVDPDEDPSLRQGFGAAFWAAILIGLAMILAGAVIGFFGPALFPVHHAAAPSVRLGNPRPPG